MPKKKGLGTTVQKSLVVMDELLTALKNFNKIRIKKSLKDEKIGKMINDAKEKATALSNEAEDLKDAIEGIKSNKNSRFARHVVSRFLQDELPPNA